MINTTNSLYTAKKISLQSHSQSQSINNLHKINKHKKGQVLLYWQMFNGSVQAHQNMTYSAVYKTNGHGKETDPCYGFSDPWSCR